MKTPTPFVNWPGDKSYLIPILQSRFPSKFNRYFEPFVGGGAAFFAISPRHAFLADANARLIRTYTAIRDNVEQVIEHLGEYENNRVCYNCTRGQSLAPDFDSKFNDAEIAASLIYLSKTCKDGIYSVDNKNRFNAPYGKHQNPIICDADNLRACSMALQGVVLKCADFADTLSQAQEGDVIYLDPPELHLLLSSSVTHYTADGFSIEDHQRLREVAFDLAKRGAHVIVSYSAAPLVFDYYWESDFDIAPISWNASTAANPTAPGVAMQVLITSKVTRTGRERHSSTTAAVESQRTAELPGASSVDSPTSEAEGAVGAACASLREIENAAHGVAIVGIDKLYGLSEFDHKELVTLRASLPTSSDDSLEHSIGFYENRCMPRLPGWFKRLSARRRKYAYLTTLLDRVLLSVLRAEQAKRVEQGRIDMSQYSVERLRELSRNYLRRFEEDPTETNRALLHMVQAESARRGLQCIASTETDVQQMTPTKNVQESQAAREHEPAATAPKLDGGHDMRQVVDQLVAMVDIIVDSKTHEQHINQFRAG